MPDIQQRDGLYGFEFLERDLRRKEAGERKTYNIKQMWQISHEIVNLAVRGFKEVEIAEILNVHPQTVSNTLNSDLGKAKLSDIRKERDEDAAKVAEKIRVLTNKAISVYHDIFDAPEESLDLMSKKTAADTVLLELSGLRVPTKIHSFNESYQLSKEELEEFKQRGVQAALESGMIADEEELLENEVYPETD